MEGNYELEKSDNFENFIKQIDPNFDMSKMDKTAKSSMTVEVNGDQYTIRTQTGQWVRELKFKLGQEFEDKMGDNHQFKNLITMDGERRLKHVQTNVATGKVVDIERQFTDTGCEVKQTINGVTWTRLYKRV